MSFHRGTAGTLKARKPKCTTPPWPIPRSEPTRLPLRLYVHAHGMQRNRLAVKLSRLCMIIMPSFQFHTFTAPPGDPVQ